MVNILSDLAGEGAYRAGVAMYQSEDKARQLRMSGEAARREGVVLESGARARAGAYRLSALGSAVTGGATLYDKYWPSKKTDVPAQDPFEIDDWRMQG